MPLLTAGFLNLSTVAVLGRMVLCCVCWWLLGGEGRCPEFSSNPGFYPLDARSTVCPKLRQPKVSPDFAKLKNNAQRKKRIAGGISESRTRVRRQDEEEENEAVVECPKIYAYEALPAEAGLVFVLFFFFIYYNKSVLQKILGFYTLIFLIIS